MYIGKSEIFFIIIGILLGILGTRYFFAIKGKYIEQFEKSLIEKKDLFYWIFILITFGVFWASKDLYLLDNFSEYVGFAGTITSIILGLVAIIYSFFQGYDSSKSSEDIRKIYVDIKKSNETLSENIDEIIQMKEILQLTIDKSNDSLTKNIDEVINMKESLQKTFDMSSEMRNNIEELRKILDSVKSDLRNGFEEMKEAKQSTTTMQVNKDSLWNTIPSNIYESRIIKQSNNLNNYINNKSMTINAKKNKSQNLTKGDKKNE